MKDGNKRVAIKISSNKPSDVKNAKYEAGLLDKIRQGPNTGNIVTMLNQFLFRSF